MKLLSSAENSSLDRKAQYLPAGRRSRPAARRTRPALPGPLRTAARDRASQQAQNDERDRDYFTPAVRRASHHPPLHLEPPVPHMSRRTTLTLLGGAQLTGKFPIKS
jgi:hypothetical protein